MDVTKVLVLSDTHTRNENALKAIEREKPFDLLVHLGDGQGFEDELQKAAGVSCYFVRGNCDYGDFPFFTVFYLGTHKVFAAHGHRYHVDFGTESMEQSARMYGCDVMMYGHTHVPDIRQKKDMLILNPGSISLPRQVGGGKTYIVITVDQNGRLVPELKML